MIGRPPAGAGRDDSPHALIGSPPSRSKIEPPAGTSVPIADVRPLAQASVDCLADLDSLLDEIEIVEASDSGVLVPIESDPSLTDKTFMDGLPETTAKAFSPKALSCSGRKGTSVNIKSPYSPSQTPVSPLSIEPKEEQRPRRRKNYRFVDPTEPKTLFHLPRTRKPGLKPWRRLNRAEKFVMWDRAIEARGERLGFTLNLHPDREAFYREKNFTAAAILKDITRCLERNFGRPIPVALALEETDERRLHIHGIGGVGKEDAELFRRSLREAVGTWDETRQFQSQTDDKIDGYWANYCVKNRNTRLSLDAKSLPGRFRKLNINGSFIAANVNVRREAKALYEASIARFSDSGEAGAR